MAEKDLKALFVHQLKDTYFAENAILKALPQMAEAAQSEELRAAQAVEHYEITRYGTLLAWAKQLGLSEAEGLLQETLIEEENTDELLSDLAEDAINPAAAA